MASGVWWITATSANGIVIRSCPYMAYDSVLELRR